MQCSAVSINVQSCNVMHMNTQCSDQNLMDIPKSCALHLGCQLPDSTTGTKHPRCTADETKPARRTTRNTGILIAWYAVLTAGTFGAEPGRGPGCRVPIRCRKEERQNKKTQDNTQITTFALCRPGAHLVSKRRRGACDAEVADHCGHHGWEGCYGRHVQSV